jgi:hypothetical protein
MMKIYPDLLNNPNNDPRIAQEQYGGDVKIEEREWEEEARDAWSKLSPHILIGFGFDLYLKGYLQACRKRQQVIEGLKEAILLFGRSEISWEFLIKVVNGEAK